MMLLAGMPLKVKIIGIAVLAVLALSLVGTAWGTLDQIAQEDSAGRQPAQGKLVSQIDNSGDLDDSVTISTLKFVCPFH